MKFNEKDINYNKMNENNDLDSTKDEQLQPLIRAEPLTKKGTQ